MSLHYLGKHEPGNCVFSVRHRHVSSAGECGWLRACRKARGRHFEHLLLCYNWPVLFRATHILQEKIHACGVLKRHNFRVHVSLGSAETLVRRGGIINHHSIAYSLSNSSARNYRNRLMSAESIVCNISVVFWPTLYSEVTKGHGAIWVTPCSVEKKSHLGKYVQCKGQYSVIGWKVIF